MPKVSSPKGGSLGVCLAFNVERPVMLGAINMPLDVNLFAPVARNQSSTSADQANGERIGATPSAGNNANVAETSAGAGQPTEAKASQTVQPVSTDVAITISGKSDSVRSSEAVDASDVAARKFATRARAESIVAALIDAISAPIQASEMAAVDAAEAELEAGEAQQMAVEQSDQSESGASALRADS